MFLHCIPILHSISWNMIICDRQIWRCSRKVLISLRNVLFRSNTPTIHSLIIFLRDLIIGKRSLPCLLNGGVKVITVGWLVTSSSGVNGLKGISFSGHVWIAISLWISDYSTIQIVWIRSIILLTISLTIASSKTLVPWTIIHFQLYLSLLTIL